MKNDDKMLINFYEINEHGHIFYAYGDECPTEAKKGDVIAYAIDKKKLGSMTAPEFVKEMLKSGRHFGFYNVDRTTIAVVGRNRVEFGCGFNTMCDIAFDAFALDDADRWCVGEIVDF